MHRFQRLNITILQFSKFLCDGGQELTMIISIPDFIALLFVWFAGFFVTTRAKHVQCGNLNDEIIIIKIYRIFTMKK